MGTKVIVFVRFIFLKSLHGYLVAFVPTTNRHQKDLCVPTYSDVKQKYPLVLTGTIMPYPSRPVPPIGYSFFCSGPERREQKVCEATTGFLSGLACLLTQNPQVAPVAIHIQPLRGWRVFLRKTHRLHLWLFIFNPYRGWRVGGHISHRFSLRLFIFNPYRG